MKRASRSVAQASPPHGQPVICIMNNKPVCWETCLVVFFPLSRLPTSCSQLSLPSAGSGSRRALGFSAISSERVRSGLALEGRMCQNRGPLSPALPLRAVSL